jgi:competence protein ComEA
MKIIKYTLSALLLTMLLTFSSVSIAQEVNINTADALTLASNLSGVGLKKAEAIVAWRSQNGNFTDLTALKNVKGIGQKTVEKNKENINF